jgi:sugar phosphate isomerase/epimerase
MKKRTVGLKATLDVKQARQSGIFYGDYIDEMGEDIVTVHLSDVDANGKMCLPGKGVTDFYDLFKRLNDVGFDGALLIEAYQNDYKDYSELFESLDYVGELSQNIFTK